jgi:hypothetical protein
MKQPARSHARALAQREQHWDDEYDALEAVIAKAVARDDEAFALRLHDALTDLEDQRCPSCGRFEDDPSDLHADWCRFATMPRPSIDRDSSVPPLEQLRQILIVNQMNWSSTSRQSPKARP